MDEGLIKGGKLCQYTARAGDCGQIVQPSNVKLGHFLHILRSRAFTLRFGVPD